MAIALAIVDGASKGKGQIQEPCFRYDVYFIKDSLDSPDVDLANARNTHETEKTAFSPVSSRLSRLHPSFQIICPTSLQP